MSEEESWRSFGNATSGAIDTMAHAYRIKDLCESPIEIFFGAAISKLLQETKASIRPQYPLGRFRYDFALMIEGIDRPILLVECDGAAFHSTMEQVENDHRKDQAARAAHLPLIRFTGREIYRNAEDCAKRALRYVFPGLP